MRTFLEMQRLIFNGVKRVTRADTSSGQVTGHLDDKGDNEELRDIIQAGINFCANDIQKYFPRAHWLPRKKWNFDLVSGTTDYLIDHECFALIKVWDRDEEANLPIRTLEWYYENYPDPSDDDADKPGLCVDAGITTAATYSTGTAHFAKGRDEVVGIGTTWTSAHSGERIRRDGDSVDYEFTYVSATSGTLDRAYEGKSTARRDGADYGINPTPRLHILIHPEPNVTNTIDYLGSRKLPRLTNDGDISPICFVDDNALYLGGLWHAIKHVVPHDEVQVQSRAEDYRVAREAIGLMPSVQTFNEQIIPYTS